MTVLKPKATTHWKRERGPRQLRAALAAEARRRQEAPPPTTKPDLAAPIARESGPQ
jgi:hypothetical protein